MPGAGRVSRSRASWAGAMPVRVGEGPTAHCPPQPMASHSGGSTTRASDVLDASSLNVPAWLLREDVPVEVGGERVHLTPAHADTKSDDGGVAPARESCTASASKDEDDDPLAALLTAPIAIRRGQDPHAVRLLDGFRILDLRMRDVHAGTVLWQRDTFDMDELWTRELEAHLPATTLNAASVTRAMTFHSRESMRHFYMVQRVFLHDTCIECFDFDFGFVIPGSTNSWEQMVEADVEGGMLPLHVLNGNLRVEMQFYDKDVLLGTCVTRVFYDR